MRKICVVIGSRANYSSIKSAMQAIDRHPELELQVVIAASALLDRYGQVSMLVEKDGFSIAGRVHMLIEGETPVTMAKSTGLGLLELPTVFEQIRPDIVLTVGDRFETMATTLAAAYMNILLAHTMGGEVSGTIDESIRHAVTKFAQIHFPASSDARDRIIKLGERPENVFLVGCPRMDLVAELLQHNGNGLGPDLFSQGVGGQFSLDEPFFLVSQHSVTTEFGEGERQINVGRQGKRAPGIADGLRADQTRYCPDGWRPIRNHGDHARGGVHEHSTGSHNGRRSLGNDRRKHSPRGHEIRPNPFPC